MARRSRGAWVVALAVAAAGVAAVLTPVIHKPGRGPGWDIMPDDWFKRPVREQPADWPANRPILRLDVDAADITIVPEARDDIAVTRLPPNMRMTRAGVVTTVADGSKAGFLAWCDAGRAGEGGAVLVHLPREATVWSRGAVRGRIGAAESLQLVSQGCGRWTIAPAAGRLMVAQQGEGDVVAAGPKTVVARVDGAGRILVDRAGEALDAYVDGNGTVTVARADGRLDVETWGGGQVRVRTGVARQANLFARGRGARVEHLGQVATLTAEARNGGVITLKKVTGTVSVVEKAGGRVSYGRPADRHFCKGMACA